MGQRVVVVGGGYGGASLARRLDEHVEVVLVEPKDAFVHASAALRVVVDPAWEERVFLPLDRLLTHGRVVHDWARLVTDGRVHLSAGEAIDADVLVLATGTGYPFPAKFLEDRTDLAQARLARLRADLERCERVMIVGGGPVGLELAGELTAAVPGLGVTVVDREPDVLMAGDYLPELRTTVREQLAARGVDFVLGAPLGYLPMQDVGLYAPFSVETTAGTRIDAQMWFRAYGSRAQTDYLDTRLASLRHYDGTLPVTEHLTVRGYDRLFAIGDISDVRESKRASAAMDHAEVVATNVLDVLAGRAPSATYTPARERIVLPLGPEGGASQLEGEHGRVVVGPVQTSEIKGRDLFSTAIAELFNR
ncbi:FAD-dependent oxidoreductase [Cellulomonas sp. APG4]|uniref:FAD-dependent oxidoreductase n=1 Tax=Cellulomonas sp. APG4 TaxID=1538656 RepID=UPI00137A8C28|nr:FAD-dependent oxidoreductase [Cellulomonas sp. APG4]NCT89383.1 FAD-dependent oxidoreductase [Cellulomonas sp. APG4]